MVFKSLQKYTFISNKTYKFLTSRYKSSLPTPLLTQLDKEGKLKLDSSYDPVKVEDGWFQYWQNNRYFVEGNDNKKFSMVLPPPNVTGKLHLGHGLTFTIQDTLARYYRMKGYKVNLVMGYDHAGIATETIVTRHIQQTLSLSPTDLSETQFLNEINKFSENNRKVIDSQIARLGLSYNDENSYFTLDERRSRMVKEVFIKLFKEGLIKRKFALVNYCFKLNTVISDIEVDNQVYEKPEILKLIISKSKSIDVETGYVYHIDYLLEDGSKLVVSTTRPETMLGDELLAVHPEDKRYQHLIGKYAYHPLIKDKKLKVVADATLVNMEIHSGVVKVTPAHDPNDLAAYLRHFPETTDQQLVKLNTFDNSGNIAVSDRWPSLSGLHRFEARTLIVDQLQLENKVEKVAAEGNYIIRKCSRSGDFIEDQFQPQWFLNLPEMKHPTEKLLEMDKIQFLPNQFKLEFQRWLNNLRPWCISRQLVWGHQIPAYTCQLEDNVVLTEIESKIYQSKLDGKWFVASDINLVKQQIVATIKGNLNLMDKLKIVQDQDVLDTWFSSALLPLSTNLDWKGPNSMEKLKNYPTDVMETGSDILFFWVVRMTLLCTHLTTNPKDLQLNQNIEPPFQQVLLHPMVRDKLGRKMSKSLGNVIDLLHIIQGIDSKTWLQQLNANTYLPPKEIAISKANFEKEFPKGMLPNGADALRFALLSYLQQGRQINLNLDTVSAAKHFGNKLWQICKYLLHLKNQSNNTNFDLTLSTPTHQISSPAQHYLIHNLNLVIQGCNSAVQERQLFKLPISLRSFTEEILSDNFIQLTKNNKDDGDLKVLDFTIKQLLVLLHPVMPFLTEHLWHHLHHPINVKPLIIQPYPDSNTLVSQTVDPSHVFEFEIWVDLLHKVRKLKSAKMGLNQVEVIIRGDKGIALNGSEFNFNLESSYLKQIESLTKCQLIFNINNLVDQENEWNEAVQIVNTNYFLIPKFNSSDTNSTPHLINVDKVRLLNLKKLVKILNNYVKILAARNEQGYIRVDERVKEKHKDSLIRLQQELEGIERKLN